MLHQGRRWENRARDYLRRHGLRPLLSRYRCRFGELDLVCTDGCTLVIVEVRARAHGSVVHSIDSIGPEKRRRIVRAASHLLMKRPEWSELPLRFDVVAIDGIDSTRPRFAWIRDAFDAG